MNDTVNRFPVVLGEAAEGSRSVVIDLLRSSNILIAGVPGAGKSNELLNIVLQLAALPPSNCMLAVIDAKTVDFALFSTDLPTLAAPIANTPDEAIDLLDALIQELDYRFKRLKSAGARNIHEFCQMGDSMPPITLVIDEVSHLLTVAAKAESTLIRLASLGRAAGIVVVLASQRAATDTLRPRLTACFGTRLAFRSSAGSSVAILGRCGAESLRTGEFLLASPEHPEIIRCRAPLIAPNQVASTLRVAGEQFGTAMKLFLAVKSHVPVISQHRSPSLADSAQSKSAHHPLQCVPIAIATALARGLWRVMDLLFAAADWSAAGLINLLRRHTRKLDRQRRRIAGQSRRRGRR